MNLDTKKFERLYLGNEVYIKFENIYLERTGRWIDTNQVFKGTLTKKNSTYYNLIGETDNKDSLLYGFSFSINKIQEIKLVKEDVVNVSNTKRKR